MRMEAEWPSDQQSLVPILNREKESFFKNSDLKDAAPLSVLALNWLGRAKIRYLWELTSKTEAELLELGVGKKSSERN